MYFRDDTHMTSMKIAQFSRPPPPLSIYVQNSSTHLTLDVQFQTTPPPFQMITNQLKENIIQGRLLFVTRSFFQVIFSINLLILSGFPLKMYKVAHSLASEVTSVLFLRNNNMQNLSQSEFLVAVILWSKLI